MNIISKILAKIYSNKNYCWVIFSVTAFGTFMATLDGTVVNISLPSISKMLHSDISTIQWVVTAYLLVVSSCLAIFGRLGDIINRRKLYCSGFLLFILGSLCCALSSSAIYLILSRIIQGIGASILMSNSPAIIARTFKDKNRGRALGMIGMTVALGSLSGPILGGLLLHFYGWQSIFLINIPIGILGALCAYFILPQQEEKNHTTFDFKGSFTFIIAIFCLLLFLNEGHIIGWFSVYSIIIIICSLLAFIAFYNIEKVTEHPAIDLLLFRNKTFLFCNIGGLLSFISMFSNVILLPFYLDKILGFPSYKIGFMIVPFPIFMGLLAPISGFLSEKVNHKILTSIGMIVILIGLLIFTTFNQYTHWYEIVLAQAIVGSGCGIFQSPNNNSVLSSVETSKLGIASGINSLMRNMGMIIGISMSVSVFETSKYFFNTNLPTLMLDRHTIIFLQSYHNALYVGCISAFIGLLISLTK